MSEEIVEDTLDEVEVESLDKSMDDTIRETLEKINARGEESEEQIADRQRDAQGRFAKKEGVADAPENAEPVGEVESPAPEVQQAPTVPPELQRLGLRKEEAEAISKDPAVLQAFIRRSEEMHKGLEQYRSKAQFGVQIEQAIAPFMATLQSIGATPEVAVKTLMAADHSLRYGTPEQKASQLMKIAKDYGIDIGQVQQYQAEQPYVDPQVQALQGQLQQMQSWIQQQNQQREWQERQTLNSEIGKFSQDPSNKYFGEVRNEMAGLLQAGLATDLKDAYEKAIYANSTVRARVLAEQQAAVAEQRKAEVTQKAQVAKRAASVNLPRKGILPSAKPVGSMDDTIRETAQRLGIM
jgi:hypothetical protein